MGFATSRSSHVLSGAYALGSLTRSVHSQASTSCRSPKGVIVCVVSSLAMIPPTSPKASRRMLLLTSVAVAWAVRNLMSEFPSATQCSDLALDDPNSKVCKFLRYYREVYGQGTLQAGLIEVS